MFFSVDETGQPLPSPKSDRAMPFRVYYAAKPCLAAVKAYYAQVRSQRQGKEEAELMSAQNLESIEAEARSVASAEAVERYMALARSARSEPSTVIRLRRPDETKVRTYLVGYARVLRPNKHEVEKGIVKVAIAKLQ